MNLSRVSALMAASILVALGASAESQSGAGDSSSMSGAAKEQQANQQRANFLEEANATVQGAKQVAQRIDAGLKKGTLQALERKDLQKLETNISEVESKSLQLQNAPAGQMTSAFKDAQKALETLQDSYFPAAAHFQEARAQEEQQIQAQLSELEQQKSTLQSAATAAQLSSNQKSDVEKTVNSMDQTIQSTQKQLTKLQNARREQWASLRSDVDDTLDESEQAYYETIRKVTKRS